MKFYNDWALRIAHGQWTDGHAFYGLPGYAYLLAAIYACVGFDPFAVGLLQAFTEAGTAVLIWKIALGVFSGTRELGPRGASAIGTIAATGWAFFQPAQTFSIILMPTAWMIAAFWFCVWRAIETKTASLWQPWLLLGFFIGLVANLVATILFLIPLLVVSAFLAFSRERPLLRLGKTLASSLVLLAAVFLGTAPCWLHNYFIAHEPVLLSAHSGINFYIGNNPIANGYPKIPPGMRAGQEGMLKDSITMAENAAGRPLRRAEVSQFWSAKARDYIHAHFTDWLRLMAVKFRNFWNAYQYDDLSLVTLFAQSHILLPGLRFGLVATLGLVGMAVAAVAVPRSRWITAAVLLHMAALLPVFVTERYRLAAVPGLLLLGSYGLCKLWHSLTTSEWPAAATYLSLGSAAAFFVSWPQSDPGLWSLDCYNTGIKETEAGNYTQARQDLELAYSYVPDNSEINFALANVWLQEGDSTRAKQFYRRAIELNARHSGAYNNLGVLAMEEKRWELAKTFLVTSLQIEPEDAKTHYLLARTELALQDLEGARAQIAEALRLKPQQKEFQALSEELAAPSKQP